MKTCHRRFSALALVLGLPLVPTLAAQTPQPPAGPTLAQVLAESTPADWRRPDPENVLYLELPAGRVVLELAPQFAPRHAENVRKLVREGYFDGLSVLRAQDNYVVQWGDPAAEAGDAAKARPITTAKAALAAEFDRPAQGLPFTVLPDGDVYAPQAGFSEGFHAARDPASGRAWLAHCYGALGVSRDNTADSGSGAGLYVVIGHSPRHLDRNITLAGRVLLGMERLSTLPRGGGPLGFYEKPEQYLPIVAMKVAADLPAAERTALEVFRTDTPAFARLIEARRNRREPWFLDPVGHVELCNVPIPVREGDSQ